MIPLPEKYRISDGTKKGSRVLVGKSAHGLFNTIVVTYVAGV